MPQVMQPDTCDLGRFANRRPTFLDIRYRPIACMARENPFGLCVGPQLDKQLQSRSRQRHTMLFFLFPVGAGFRPNPLIQIELIPSSAEDLPRRAPVSIS